MFTPVKILSDVSTPEGKNVAMVAVTGYEKYAVPVSYWPEIKNEPTDPTKPGNGPLLAAKWIVKEAALIAPRLVTNGLKQRQDHLAALPAVPPVPEVDPHADERVAMQTEITKLNALKAIVEAEDVGRIDDFYTAWMATIPLTDTERRKHYQSEWDDAKAAAGGGPALPTTI